MLDAKSFGLTGVATSFASVLVGVPALPCLERLSISGSLLMEHVLRLFPSDKFPQLHNVELSHISTLLRLEVRLGVRAFCSHISSLELVLMEVDLIIEVLAVCQVLENATVKKPLFSLSSPFLPDTIVCNISSFNIVGASFSDDVWGQLFSRLALPRLSRIQIATSDVLHDQVIQPVGLLAQNLVDLLSRSRCSLTSMSLKCISIEEDHLLDIFQLTPNLIVLILKGRETSLTEKILRNLATLLPRLTQLETPVCTEQSDLILTVLESRRPNDSKPSSSSESDSIISLLTRAVIAPCHCDLCMVCEVPDSIAWRVDKLRQSGLRMSILFP